MPIKEGLNLLNFEFKGNCDVLIDNIQIDEKSKKVYFQKHQVI